MAACYRALADAAPLHFRFRLRQRLLDQRRARSTPSGTLVRTLWSNRRYPAGLHEASWDGRDDDGRGLFDGRGVRDPRAHA